jgi:hypothetical protein
MLQVIIWLVTAVVLPQTPVRSSAPKIGAPPCMSRYDVLATTNRAIAAAARLDPASQGINQIPS